MAGGGVELIIAAGVATAFNVAIIKYKFDRGQSFNALLDSILLGLVMWIFHGSFSALAVGTIASAIISVYLIFSPLDEKIFDDF